MNNLRNNCIRAWIILLTICAICLAAGYRVGHSRATAANPEAGR